MILYYSCSSPCVTLRNWLVIYYYLSILKISNLGQDHCSSIVPTVPSGSVYWSSTVLHRQPFDPTSARWMPATPRPYPFLAPPTPTKKTLAAARGAKRVGHIRALQSAGTAPPSCADHRWPPPPRTARYGRPPPVSAAAARRTRTSKPLRWTRLPRPGMPSPRRPWPRRPRQEGAAPTSVPSPPSSVRDLCPPLVMFSGILYQTLSICSFFFPYLS